MHAAAAKLQTAAQRLISGVTERSDYTQIISQLRAVANELAALERRAGQGKADPVHLTAMLWDAAAKASSASGQSGITVAAVEGITVEGPAADLQELISSLLEFALGMARDTVEIRADSAFIGSRAACALKLVVRCADMPDFLRRKLWDVAHRRRGQVSIVSEADRCRVTLTLPLERRLVALNS